MAKEKPPKQDLDRGEFAQAVIKLYRWNISAKAPDAPFAGDTRLEVRRCANGLALITQLLDDYMLKNTLVGAEIAAAGVGDAYAILDHLTSGRDHPIAKHIKGLHSGTFRPQHAPANKHDRLVQRIVVGAVLAIQAHDEPGQNAAIKKLVENLEQAGVEGYPTAGQVKSWYHALRSDDGPRAYAGEILKRATACQTSPLQEGVWMIFEHTGVAVPRAPV